ncbi:MAG TPA: hypothetical protein VKV80_10385 [Streptosporangiaceae bacterium]|nr:hypothetical protein [Streptosporangiaceae bacterium]
MVAADGAVAGLVSEYGLLAREGETAGEVMTSPVITGIGGTDVGDVRHLLAGRRVRPVPALSAGAGDGGRRLAGIVSRGGVVALLTTERACRVCGQAVRGRQYRTA